MKSEGGGWMRQPFRLSSFQIHPLKYYGFET